MTDRECSWTKSYWGISHLKGLKKSFHISFKRLGVLSAWKPNPDSWIFATVMIPGSFETTVSATFSPADEEKAKDWCIRMAENLHAFA